MWLLWTFFIFCCNQTQPVKFLSAEQYFVHAAETGKATIVQDLLKQGADPSAYDPYGCLGQTPLIGACEHGHLAVARLLVDAGADMAATDAYGWTALMRAAENKHRKIAQFLIDRGAQVDREDKYGQSAFTIAISNDDYPMVRLLLSRGAAINPGSSSSNDTPLIVAAVFAGKEIVEMLVSRGAHVNATNKFSWNALMHATSRGHTDKVALLLQYGADPFAKNKSKKNSLDLADNLQTSDIIQLYMDTYTDALEYHVDLTSKNTKAAQRAGKKNFRKTYRQNIKTLDEKMHNQGVTKCLENIQDDSLVSFHSEHQKHWRLRFYQAFQKFKKHRYDKDLRTFFFHPTGGLVCRPGLVPMVEQFCKRDEIFPILVNLVARTPCEKKGAKKIEQVLKDRDAFFKRHNL